jgi:hypothetical protein
MSQWRDPESHTIGPSRALALRTFAASPEHFSRKKDHSRSEAALIALFGASL